MRALQNVITGRGPVEVDDVTRALVDSLCAHQRDELETVAATLAARLYAEQPDDFVGRVAQYWSTRV